MNEKQANFTHNLNFLKNCRKLSATSIAKDLGLNRATVRGMLNGKVDPRLTWIDKVCKKYSVTYEWLTTGKAGEVKECTKQSQSE